MKLVLCGLSSVGVGAVTAAHVIRVQESDLPCHQGRRTTDNGRSADKATYCACSDLIQGAVDT